MQPDLTCGGKCLGDRMGRAIRLRVGAEFDRVATAIASKATTPIDRHCADAQDAPAVITILEEKRAEDDEAGYYIRHWQELNDQVRQMIIRDPRFQAIKANQLARRAVRKRGRLPVG
jgi:hypothetical protein